MNLGHNKRFKYFAILAAALLSAQTARAILTSDDSREARLQAILADQQALRRAVADARRLTQRVQAAITRADAWGAKSGVFAALGYTFENPKPWKAPLQKSLSAAQKIPLDKSAFAYDLRQARAHLHRIKGDLLKRCSLWKGNQFEISRTALKELRAVIASIDTAIDGSTEAEQDREMAILKTLAAMHFRVEEMFGLYWTLLPKGEGSDTLLATLDDLRQPLSDAEFYIGISNAKLEKGDWRPALLNQALRSHYPSTQLDQVKRQMVGIKQELAKDTDLKGKVLIIHDDAAAELDDMIAELEAVSKAPAAGN